MPRILTAAVASARTLTDVARVVSRSLYPGADSFSGPDTFTGMTTYPGATTYPGPDGFGGPDTFPGSTTYPGRGDELSSSPADARDLTAIPA